MQSIIHRLINNPRCRKLNSIIDEPQREKMWSAILSTFVTVAVVRINGEKSQCSMVPIQTNEGLMGYCCVFFKNSSSMDSQKDQIIRALSNEKEKSDNIQTNVRGSDFVRFPDNIQEQPRTEIPPGPNKTLAFSNVPNKIKENHTNEPPQHKPSESKENGNFGIPGKKKEEDGIENTKPQSNSEDKIVYPGDADMKPAENNATDDLTIVKEHKPKVPPNVVIGGRNKDDVPETCTEGEGQDINGNCAPEF